MLHCTHRLSSSSAACRQPSLLILSRRIAYASHSPGLRIASPSPPHCPLLPLAPSIIFWQRLLLLSPLPGLSCLPTLPLLPEHRATVRESALPPTSTEGANQRNAVSSYDRSSSSCGNRGLYERTSHPSAIIRRIHGIHSTLRYVRRCLGRSEYLDDDHVVVAVVVVKTLGMRFPAPEYVCLAPDLG